LKSQFLLAFHYLKGVKLSAIQSFTPQERTNLKEAEEKFKPHILYSNLKNQVDELGDNNNERLIALKKELYPTGNELMELFEDYKIVLMDILEKHGYLIKKAIDHARMF